MSLFVIINNAHSCSDVGFWAQHLQNIEENERAELKQIRGLHADTLPEALEAMQRQARINPRTKNFMYHADFNPRRVAFIKAALRAHTRSALASR